MFSTLPLDGSAVGNSALRRYLSWSQRRYFTVRDELVDKGLALRGRGRGGAVRRAEAEPPPAVPAIAVVVETDTAVVAAITAVVPGESPLFRPMCHVIENDWARDRRQDLLAVEITAQQGHHQGIWSRPDIVTVEVRTFQYLPGKYLEINTFEVKSFGAVNVQAVYEALAHRRAATRSYVLFYIPPEHAPALDDAVAVVAEAARMHGIGLVIAANPGDYETWEEREEAHRIEPDPERLDSFIATQLSDETRNHISRRLR
jgi:hypothetical protein